MQPAAGLQLAREISVNWDRNWVVWVWRDQAPGKHTGGTHGACSHVPTSQHSAMQIIDLSKISICLHFYSVDVAAHIHRLSISPNLQLLYELLNVECRYFIGTAADSDIGSNIFYFALAAVRRKIRLGVIMGDCSCRSREHSRCWVTQ